MMNTALHFRSASDEWATRENVRAVSGSNQCEDSGGSGRLGRAAHRFLKKPHSTKNKETNGMKNSTPEPTDKFKPASAQNYWVIFQKRAANCRMIKLVKAVSAEEAKQKAVKAAEDGRENGKDDRCLAVEAYTLAELPGLLAKMSRFDAEEALARSVQYTPESTSALARALAARLATTRPKIVPTEPVDAAVVPVGRRGDRISQNLKIYLATLGTRSWSVTDPIENSSLLLVRAENSLSAYIIAMQIHLAEGFEEQPDGEWEFETTISESKGRIGFRLDDFSNDEKAGCFQWVEKVVEVAPEDVAVVERYLADWKLPQVAP